MKKSKSKESWKECYLRGLFILYEKSKTNQSSTMTIPRELYTYKNYMASNQFDRFISEIVKKGLVEKLEGNCYQVYQDDIFQVLANN